MDIFEIFKAEVENQHDLKIKIVRSDLLGEYYGWHTPSFWTFCEVPYGKWHSCLVFHTGRASAERSSRKKKPYTHGYGKKHDELLHTTD